jgi:Protein of unknown function (DUF3500)
MQIIRRNRGAAALGLFIVALAGGVVSSQRAASAAAMATAATRFLEGLSPELRQKATFAYESDERMRWHFIPTNQFPRNGVPIKEMTEPQRELARNLLRAALSQKGMLTATSIMELEIVLKGIESAGGGRGGMNRDPELYFFSVFGTPAPNGIWGWRVEGHHMSLHFSIANNTAVASSPVFFGANPHEIRQGPQTGHRVLAAEEDTGRALVVALDEKQRAAAIFNPVAPGDIVTMTTLKVDPLTPPGLAASAMSAKQRELLMQIIDVYASKMAEDTAATRLAKIKQAGLEKISFAWAGEVEKGKKHYYRVQGPTFLIEYDNTQNDGNHVHSVWRDFNGDFGRDLLREHLRAYPH